MQFSQKYISCALSSQLLTEQHHNYPLIRLCQVASNRPLTLALSHIPLCTAHRASDTNSSFRQMKFFSWLVVVEHFQQCTVYKNNR